MEGSIFGSVSCVRSSHSQICGSTTAIPEEPFLHLGYTRRAIIIGFEIKDEMPPNPPPRLPRRPAQPGGEPVTLPQLLELVEKACQGDKTLSQQLFAAFMQMRLRPTTPPNERALADVLIRILIGEREPSLAELDADDVQPVQDVLARLRQR